MDSDAVRVAILEVEGVADVHHLHLWNLASDIPTLTAHIVVTGEPTLRDANRIADELRVTLASRFSLTHTTFELECGPT